MASLVKTSVRDEVSRLKADFDRLGAEGKLSSDILDRPVRGAVVDQQDLDIRQGLIAQ